MKIRKNGAEPLPTRPRRCLKYLLVAAAALFAVNFFLHLGYLLPIQAVRSFEEREGIPGRTAVISRRRVPEIGNTFMLYLTGNRQATALGSVQLTFYGWMEYFGRAIDCSSPAPFYIGENMLGRELEDGQYFRGVWYYGRVDDPRIERIEVSLRYAGYDEAAQKPIFPEAFLLASERGEWMERDGRLYFLMELKPLDWPHESGIYPIARAYDAAGELLHEIDIDDRISGIHGWDDDGEANAGRPPLGPPRLVGKTFSTSRDCRLRWILL